MEHEINYRKYMPLALSILRNNCTAEENTPARSNLYAGFIYKIESSNLEINDKAIIEMKLTFLNLFWILTGEDIVVEVVKEDETLYINLTLYDEIPHYLASLLDYCARLMPQEGKHLEVTCFTTAHDVILEEWMQAFNEILKLSDFVIVENDNLQLISIEDSDVEISKFYTPFTNVRVKEYTGARSILIVKIIEN